MISRPQLECNIVRTCTNRCAACSHAAPWAPTYFMPPEVLERDLKDLAPVLHAEQFWLLGGEPLLHPKIDDLLEVAQRCANAAEVGIITNGQLLEQMTEWFWTHIKLLRVSVYPNLDAAKVTLAEEKQKAHGFKLETVGIPKFWKQFANSDGAHFNACPWTKQCLTIHDGFLYLCPQAAFFPEQFMGLPEHTDGFPVGGCTEVALQACLDRTEPYTACRICCSFKEQTDWHQCETKEEWLKDSTI